MNQLFPVHDIKASIVQTLKKQNRLILRAPAGSGKSTLVPQFILDDVLPPEKLVIVLQPRRIAARMLAGYVAKSRNTVIGDQVGYKVRLEGKQSSNTRILFVTEGILLNRLLNNDPLNEIGAIVFDEFHERHLETDISLALALQLQQNQRPDLAIIVMSATLDIQQVVKFMGNCPVLQTEGRTYPVSIQFKQAKPYETIWDFAAFQLEAALPSFKEGSALIFMPGAYEIRKTIEAIAKRQNLSHFEILPLYSSLSKQEQDKAVSEEGRKIIVSTNVAETSLTLPNIRLVIDSGLARVARFDPKRGINTLFVEAISHSSAEQRAGRAGRTAEGSCIRLWGAFEDQNKIEREIPEIHRVDLSETILGILASGIQSVSEFPWLEKPGENAINNALELLQNLSSIDSTNKITPIGSKMAKLSIHPRFGRMLIEAEQNNCLPSACIVAAIAQSNGIFSNTNDPIIKQERSYTFGNPSSDLLFELNAWLWAGQKQFKNSDCNQLGINTQAARQIGQLAVQLLHKFDNVNHKNNKLPEGSISEEEAYKLRKCIFSGFIDFLAIRHKLNSPTCQLMHGKSAQLHPDSIVQQSGLMVANELEESKMPNGVKITLRKATEIELEWLNELNPTGFENVISYKYDTELKQVVKVSELKLNNLSLSKEISKEVDHETASAILTQAIFDKLIDFEQWNDEVEHFVLRANFASKQAPHYQIPEINAEGKEFIIQQAIYKCRTLKDIQKCNIWPSIKAWFSNEQYAAIDVVAPVSVNIPKRKYPVKLRYCENGDVILSETVQALYDCPIPLTVAEGKVNIIFEILAPSRRPVQITRDLDYFWKNSYAEVKKELKGRYPKHEWR
jgi:ATP-dependent helicase HrpB